MPILPFFYIPGCHKCHKDECIYTFCTWTKSVSYLIAILYLHIIIIKRSILECACCISINKLYMYHLHKLFINILKVELSLNPHVCLLGSMLVGWLIRLVGWWIVGLSHVQDKIFCFFLSLFMYIHITYSSLF